MSFALRVARRYLFAKKTTNAINVISGISVLGIAVGSGALILVLSVFNGFEDLLTSLYSSFDPDLKVQPVRGKVFTPDPDTLAQLESLPYITHVSHTLEEIAFFEYRKRQDFGVIKGVDATYQDVTQLDSMVYSGEYATADGRRPLAVVGSVIGHNLAVDVMDEFTSIAVYMPKRRQSAVLSQPFKKRYMYPVGTFTIQQKYDESYIISDLEFVRDLLSYRDGEVSALELKLAPGTDAEVAAREVQSLLGSAYDVQTQYEQNESLLKLMNIEKWIGFAIISLTLVLVAFNMVGALLMLVIEKTKDIGILKAMGATVSTVRNIFLWEGLLMSMLGMMIGFTVAMVFYFLHKAYNLLPMQGFIVDAYPISLRWYDFVAVFVTVLAIGLLSAYMPARRAGRIESIVR